MLYPNISQLMALGIPWLYPLPPNLVVKSASKVPRGGCQVERLRLSLGGGDALRVG